jgi:hypothetical protein
MQARLNGAGCAPMALIFYRSSPWLIAIGAPL